MDAIFYTFTFTAISAFFQSLWAEINGRIFLTTFVAYAASYMIYSGYMSWFAGGYGGLLLTQVGFSVIDLLGLLPMAFMLLVESLWPLAKSAGKFILFYFVLPFLTLWATATFLGVLSIRIFPRDAALQIIGFLFWAVGFCLGVWAFQLKEERPRRYWLSLVLSYLGVILVGLTYPFAPLSAIKATIAPFQATQNLITNITFEGLAVMLLIILLMIPALIGRSMAAHATKRKLLSRVQKLVLKQALEIPGALLALPATQPGKKKKNPGKEKTPIVSYIWEKDRPVYLIASLNKTTALFAPPETTGEGKGRMVLLANDLICSLEI